MKYKTKPCEIEAVQFNGFNEGFSGSALSDELIVFLGEKLNDTIDIRHYELYIKTLEGEMKVNEEDYIIKGLKGEFYPCKPDIFELKYELVN